MANDRLWLTCTKCKKQILLYKYYGSEEGSYVYHSQEELDDFITYHMFDCQGLYGYGHLPHVPFTIEKE